MWTMKPYLLIALIALTFGACSTGRRTAAPQFSGTIRQASSVTDGIREAQEDNKEIKSLHRQSLGLLDRLDFKTSILLEK